MPITASRGFRKKNEEELERQRQEQLQKTKDHVRAAGITARAEARTTLDPYERPTPMTQEEANRRNTIRTQFAPSVQAAANGARFAAAQDDLPGLLQNLRVENYKKQASYYRQQAKEMKTQAAAEASDKERTIQAQIDALAAKQGVGAQDLAEYQRLQKELKAAQESRKGQNVTGMEDLARLYGDMAFIETLPQGAKDALADYWEVRGGGDASSGTLRGYESRKAQAVAVLEENGVDEEEIYALAESYSRYKNAEKMQNLQKYWEGHSTGGGGLPAWLIARGANLYGALTSGVEAFGQGLSHTFGASSYQTADPNASGFRMAANAAAIDQKQASGIKSAIARTVFKGANSAVDNGLRIAAGQLLGSANASLGLAGLGSYGSGFREAAQRGGSVEQATLYGLATGGLEILTEKIPLENLLNMKSPDSVKQALWAAAKQGGLEVAEEEISFVGGLLADAIVMGNKSEAKQRERSYVENGMSLAQARHQVFQDYLMEAAETAAVSFVSGGLMAAGNQMGQAQANKQAQIGAEESMEARRRKERQAQNLGWQEAFQGLETSEETRMEGESAGKTALEQAIEQQRENGMLSNRQAEAVLQDGEAIKALEKKGYQVAEGTASQKRAVVKTAIAELGGRGSQPPVQMAAADMIGTTDSTNTDASTGAAPAGFSQYDELQFQYGNQKDRPATEARPIDVPRRDAQGNRVSEVAGNLYGARMIPDSMIPAFEQAVADGAYSIQKKGWKEALAAARDSIEPGTEAAILRRIIENADKGKLRTSETAELLLLTNYYANRGDKTGQRMAGEAMVALQELGSEYARGLNMFKMVQRLTPEGQLAAAKKAISRTADKLNQRVKDPDKKRAVQIDAELEQDFLLASEAAQSKESAAAAEASAIISTLEARNEALREALHESVQKDAETIRALSEIDFEGERIAEQAAGNVMEEIRQELERHWESKNAAERNVARAIARETDIDIGEAQTHARKIVQKFYENLAQKQTAQMEEAFGKLGKKASKNLADKLTELYLQGDWDEQDRRRAIFDGLWGGETPVDISDELLEQYAAAAREGKEQAQRAIYMAAAAQMPGTPGEKWNAWRYMAMLGNPTTQIRNVAGNAVFTTFWKAKNIVAGAIEDVFQKDKADRSLSASRGEKALQEFAKADAKSKQAQDAMNGVVQGRDNAYKEIQAYRKIFKHDILNNAQAGLNWVMSEGDMIFKKAAYADVLSRFLHARGYTGEQAQNGQIPADVMQAGRTLAVQEAMKATFNDFNTVSNLVSRQYKGTNFVGKAWNAMVNGVFPFRRTPANILVRSFDYSPAGLLRGVANAFRAAKSGEVTMSQAIDQIAAGLTGSGVFALGAVLAANGIVTGGWIDDEDERQGYQKYAINIGGYSFTIDWLSPAAIPLFMGAELQHAIQGESGYTDWLDALGKTGKGIFGPLLEMSMLSSLDDVMTRLRQSGSSVEGVMNVLVGAAENYLLQGLPSFTARLDGQFDDNRKIVFANSDSKVLRELEYFAGKALAKVPFADYWQTEYVDEWGNKEARGNFAARLLASISPTYWSKIEENPIDREIKRLEGVTGEEASPKATGKSLVIDGETVRLSGAQWTKMQEAQGQKAFAMLTQLVNDPRYEQLTENGKYEALGKVYDYSREFGRKGVLEGYRENAAWMREKDPLAYILKEAEVSDAGLTDAQYERAKELGKTAAEMRAMSDKVQNALEQMEEPTDYDKYRAVYQAAGTDYAAWLTVYGLSDARRESLQAWVRKGNHAGDFWDGLEAASGLTKAMSEITAAWKDGKETDGDALKEAVAAYKKMDKNAAAAAREQLDGREKALLNAMNAGVSDRTFLRLYKSYYTLSQGEESAADKAVQWAAELDRAQSRGEITGGQKGQIADDLKFYAMVRQEAKKYHDMTAAGASTDTALLIGNVLDGLKPEAGKQTVSDTQKWEAILDTNLPDSQKEAALRAYMDEKQEAKLDLAAAYGVGSATYVGGKLVYDGLSGYGQGRKAQTLRSIQQELGVDRRTASLLYDIYSGKLKAEE